MAARKFSASSATGRISKIPVVISWFCLSKVEALHTTVLN